MRTTIFVLIGLVMGAVAGYLLGFDRGETRGKATAAAEFYAEQAGEIPENPIEDVGYANPFADVTVNPFAE